MTAAVLPSYDLGKLRGLPDDVLSLCNVVTVGRENGFDPGWLWDTYTLEGAKAQRWKSASSQRPEGSSSWAKYRWHPDKPSGNAGYFDPDYGLKDAIKHAFGCLYIVGGEIAAMSMFAAGFRNTTSFFGDNAIPRDTLLEDLKTLGVSLLYMIPDRDTAGMNCAATVRDLVSRDLDLEFSVYALPYEIAEKHGKDVNDLWLQLGANREAFRDAVDAMPIWKLPEPKPTVLTFPLVTSFNEDLPEGFKSALFRDVESRAPQNKAFRWHSDGWSSNIRCPFHDDKEASAGFNKESMSFKCFACGAKSAKEYGEGVGIIMRDYFDDGVPLAHSNGTAPTVKENLTAQKPVETVKPQLRPKLPAFAQLTPEQEAEAAYGRRWLDDYLDWTHKSCPLAPEIFHEAMALWLLATVATRRMKLVMGGREIYPNLYVMIVAKTSLYRKSTAMNEAKKVLKQAGLECLLLPTDVTPEALFDELAGVKPVNFDSLTPDDKKDWLQGRAVAAQRSFIKDECSSILANLRKEYNAGLSELLLEGYQGDGGKLKKLLKSKGLITVKDMCLSFLGATTPVMYAKYMTNEEQENGFVARFALITPEGIPVYETVDEPVPVPHALTDSLRRMFLDVLPWHNDERPSASAMVADVITPPTTHVTMDADAIKQLGEYDKALNYDMLISDTVSESKAAAYTRLATMVKKVAMLLAATDGEKKHVRIEARHAYAAQMIGERWRESLHRLDTDIARSAGSDNDKVLNYLRGAGETGASIRDIMRDCAIKHRNHLEDNLKTLYEDGKIEKFEYKPDGGKGGRPSIRFRLLSSSSS